MTLRRMISLAAVCVALGPGTFAGTIYTVGVLQSPAGPTPGFTSMYGIDNLGQAAGSGNNGSGQVSFVATTSEVAGTLRSTANGTTQAFTSSASGSSFVPLPVGYSYSAGDGINNFGVVVGIASNQNIVLVGAVFVDTALGVSLVPLPAGWEATNAQIGDLGQIAATGVNSNSIYQAFEGTASGLTPIPLPVGATTTEDFSAYVNSSGVVVGSSDAGGWIWDATDGTQLLTSLVPAGWNISEAMAISDNGFILAQGSFGNGPSQYVELTLQQTQSSPPPPQAPEPPPGFLASAGGVLLICGRQRRLAIPRYAAAMLVWAAWLTAPAHAGNISWVGIVNGNGEGGTGGTFGSSTGNGQSCTTYGPGFGEPSSFFGTMVGIPLGGIQTCGYFGGSLAASGALVNASISAQINNGGSSSGSASAAASLGASTVGSGAHTYTGAYTLQAEASQTLANQGSSPTTSFVSAGAALADDTNWTVSAPLLSPGTPLIPTYTFAISGNAGTPYLSGGANVAYGQTDLDMYVQQIGAEVNALGAFGVRITYGQNGITCYYNSNPLNSCAAIGFTTGAGTIQGTGVFTYTSPAYMLNDGTVEEEIGLDAIASGNAFVDPNATLIAVSFAQNTVFGLVPVTDFTLTTSSGTFTQNGFTPNAPAATPEPVAGLLAGLGLLGIAGRRWWRPRPRP